MTKPRILVLLAFHKGEEFFSEQIRSILEQNNVYIDVLISNNSPMDDFLDSYRNLKNINIINNDTTKGFAKNFYYLICKANTSKYDYFALSDQDDIFLCNKYQKMIDFMNIENSSGCSSGLYELHGNKKGKHIYQKNISKKFDYIFEGAGQGCTFLINKDCFITIKKFIMKNKKIVCDFYFHDWLIFLIARSYNYKWSFLKEPLTLYRQHNNNNFGSKYSFNGIKERFKKIKSGWYKKQIILAYNLSSMINDSIKSTSLSLIIQPKVSFLHRLILSKFIFCYGRRKSTENIVIIFSLIFYII